MSIALPENGLSSSSQALGIMRFPQSVHFGDGQRGSLGRVVAELGRKALICTDSRVNGSPLLEEMIIDLREQGIEVHVYGDTEPELPVPGIARCVAQLGGAEIDVVIGVGGGSCLDMAKVVSLLLAHGGRPEDYYGEMRVPGPILPVVAVPTTAGTGSEATPVAVLSDSNHAMKVGISSPYLIPHTAICDPHLTHSCPAPLTAATGADALTHLVESFTAVTRPQTVDTATSRVFVGKGLLTDSVALAGLQLIGRSLGTAYRNPGDGEARSDVMLAALAGGISLGTAGTAAAHALQYPIGALTHTPHGVGVGCLLPYVMRYNLPARVDEFAQIAGALGVGRARSGREAAEAAILRIDQILADIGIPPNLKEIGVREADLDEIATHSMGATRLIQNNPRPLNHAALHGIVRAALHGDLTMPIQ